MNKSIRQITTKATGIFLMLCLAHAVQAQKLPSIQSVGAVAPKDIKIDGKAVEWPQFKAYNNAIECFYTVSNNTDNLYLVLQATDYAVIAKIAAGGITLTLRSTDKKSQIAPVALTYPFGRQTFNSVSYTLRSNKTLSDSQVSELNSQISGRVKEIPVTGAKGIADSTISIYNDLGIKAAGLVDQQKAYTCEIAIPLKFIDQLFDQNGSFRYRIQMNGVDTSGKNGLITIGGKSTDPSSDPVSHDSSGFMMSPTYLNGTYTLAK